MNALPTRIDSSLAWTAAELRSDRNWIYETTLLERRELSRILDALRLKQVPEEDIACLNGVSSAFGVMVEKVQQQLFVDRGIILIRGLCQEGIDLSGLRRICLALGRCIGDVAAQNSDGDLIRCVTDLGHKGFSDDNRARGHRGRARMFPHSDSADIVGLLSVRDAKSGGANIFCSSAAIYNDIASTRPEYLEVLTRGFHFDLSGKSETNQDYSDARVSVFSVQHGSFSCSFNKSRIELGMKKAGVEISDLERVAINHLQELALSEVLALQMYLRPGDVILLNNHYTLHAREGYEDWTEPLRKRLLLRFWINSPNGRHIEHS